jgi:hypothetical protein
MPSSVRTVCPSASTKSESPANVSTNSANFLGQSLSKFEMIVWAATEGVPVINIEQFNHAFEISSVRIIPIMIPR